MTTHNIQVTTGIWTNIVSPVDTDFLITWDSPKTVEFAATESNNVPSITGHKFPREKRVTREDVGSGYVWAKLVSDSGGKNVLLTVTKSSSSMGASGGFDSSEGVQKVAMLVWNPYALSWERGTKDAFSNGSGGSGSGGSSTAPAVKMTKRTDVVSDFLIYVGEAPVGTVESAGLWSIKKITFNQDGNPTGEFIGIGSWVNRAVLNYL